MRKQASLVLILIIFLSIYSNAFCLKSSELAQRDYLLLKSFESQLVDKQPRVENSFNSVRSGVIAEIELNSGNVVSWRFFDSVPVLIELSSRQLSSAKLYYSLIDSQGVVLSGVDSVFTWVGGNQAVVDSLQSTVIEPCRNTQLTNSAFLDLSSFSRQKVATYAFVPKGTQLQIHCYTNNASLLLHYFSGDTKEILLSSSAGTESAVLGAFGLERDQPLSISDIIELIKERKVCVEKTVNKIRLWWNPERIFTTWHPEEKPQQETQAPIETDSDSDGVPDTSDNCPMQQETFNGYNDSDGCPDTLPEQPSTQTQPDYTQIEISNSLAQYNFVFLPLQWDHSLDSVSGTYEEYTDKLMNFFLQKTGLQGCDKIAKIVLSEEEVRDCGFETINLSCFDTSRAPTLILECIRRKRGININSTNNIAIALTNFPDLRKKAGASCKPVAATTTIFGQPIVIIANNKTTFVLAHELGHRLFYLCDQYDLSEYVTQDAMLKQAHMPSFAPGCQNKYPGPYSIVAGIPHAVKRYGVIYAGGSRLIITTPQGFTLDSCPAYPKCSYEVGDFITCCPNMDKATSYADCTGRFVPMRTASASAVRGVSIMGPAFESRGRIANIPRDFDCFEKEAIARIMRC